MGSRIAFFLIHFFCFYLVFSLSACTPAQLATMTSDSRFFDRDVYFAVSDMSTPGNQLRNASGHQKIVKEALIELAKNTDLGENYFRFHEMSESSLAFPSEQSTGASTFRSAILIYPQDVYQKFVSDAFGSQTPDPNAVFIVNSSNKKQFFIVFNAACFQGKCDSSSSNISVYGMYSLVVRQFGFYFGFSPADCSAKPNSIMCANPVDSQWGFKSSFFTDVNNVLKVISSNPNFWNQ